MRQGLFLFLFVGLSACAGRPPRTMLSSDATAVPARLMHAKAQCDGNTKVLATVSRSTVSWSITKTLTVEKKENPVVGSIGVAGCLFTQGESLTGATADYEFDPRSNESFDQLRDDRINEAVFGLNENLPLGFTLESITGEKSELPQKVGDSIAAKVRGKLDIGGLKPTVELPVVISKTDIGYRLVQASGFSLNARGGTPGVNILGLDSRIARLMAMVSGVSMLDPIIISFDIDLVDLCK